MGLHTIASGESQRSAAQAPTPPCRPPPLAAHPHPPSPHCGRLPCRCALYYPAVAARTRRSAFAETYSRAVRRPAAAPNPTSSSLPTARLCPIPYACLPVTPNAALTHRRRCVQLRMQHVRVEKCGQRGVMGKYCVHLHALKKAPPLSGQRRVSARLPPARPPAVSTLVPPLPPTRPPARPP